MRIKEVLKTKNKPIMVLGTSSGVGKSLTVTALCRLLRNQGEKPIPFKGQNMSNNAWVDRDGGEMAYSQALQAFASGIVPSSEMNPILLKPQGNAISEVIHLGKSVGTTTARNYYKNWFSPGWLAIQKALNKILENKPDCRLIVEGAGSPVEMNLIHRDLTNLKIAKYLNANCILVADIEKGGVFAQIIGTLELMNKEEKKLIKGIIINRFRGDVSLFSDGAKWIEKRTNIPVLGIIPMLNDHFPPEDSLDLLDKKVSNINPDMKVGIIKFPSISNFSDLDPLENEDSIKLTWIKNSQKLNEFDFIILPGSKQTIKDKLFLEATGLSDDIKKYSNMKGNIFGICGGLQILGKFLLDPFKKEGGSMNINQNGLGLLSLRTTFLAKKHTAQICSDSLWPCETRISGFEIHNGMSELINNVESFETLPIFKEERLGWYKDKKNDGLIAGTYIHGIFENDLWRDSFLKLIRDKKGLKKIDNSLINYKINKDKIINNLAQQFKMHLNMESILE